MNSAFFKNFLATSILVAGAVQASDTWERIEVPMLQQGYEITVGNISERVYPGCSIEGDL